MHMQRQTVGHRKRETMLNLPQGLRVSQDQPKTARYDFNHLEPTEEASDISRSVKYASETRGSCEMPCTATEAAEHSTKAPQSISSLTRVFLKS